MDPSTMYLTAFIIIGGIIFLVLFFHYVPFFLWLSAKVSGVNISLVQLFLMRIRNVPPYNRLLRPTSNYLSKWQLPSTLPDVMCLKLFKCR